MAGVSAAGLERFASCLSWFPLLQAKKEGKTVRAIVVINPGNPTGQGANLTVW